VLSRLGQPSPNLGLIDSHLEQYDYRLRLENFQSVQHARAKRYSPANTTQSMLLKTTRFGRLLLRTLSWCRRIRTSASNAARDRNTPTRAHQINAQISFISASINRFAVAGQPSLVCGRDRAIRPSSRMPAGPASSSIRFRETRSRRWFGELSARRRTSPGGSRKSRSLIRSRVCSASLRFASCCAGTQVHHCNSSPCLRSMVLVYSVASGGVLPSVLISVSTSRFNIGVKSSLIFLARSRKSASCVILAYASR
jgi:hypothetical protein